MIFLIDRCLSRGVHRRLAEAFTDHTFHYLDDVFKEQDTPDADWIARVGREDWTALTADDHIQRRQAEILAVREHKVKLFTLTSNHMRGEEKAAIFSEALPRIMVRCEVPGPWIVKVHRDGRLVQAWPAPED